MTLANSTPLEFSNESSPFSELKAEDGPFKIVRNPPQIGQNEGSGKVTQKRKYTKKKKRGRKPGTKVNSYTVIRFLMVGLFRLSRKRKRKLTQSYKSLVTKSSWLNMAVLEEARGMARWDL